MKLFDVYPLFDIEPVKAQGSWVWGKDGQKYLDLYGGHAVISVGHSHPRYTEALTSQLSRIAFYSNSVKMPLQEKLAELLGQLSGYPDYHLFLCNSGAEANENALKIASFATGRKKIIAFKKAFHGRTSGAVAATDNPKIVAPFNAGHEVLFLELNNVTALEQAMSSEISAVIIEGVQGVGGIRLPEDSFLQVASKLCEKHGALLILDEIQSGYGRTGKFFAHQYAGLKPHLITTAKGMGNGFPIGGVMIHPSIQAWSGMLGTTFGGNYLACAAAIAVLEIMRDEKLIENAAALGQWWKEEIAHNPLVSEVRGRGLMIGLDVTVDMATLRKNLLFNHHIFTGEAKPNTIRLLPSLALSRDEATLFVKALSAEVHKHSGQ